MNVELQIHKSTNPAAQFVGWAPGRCALRNSDPAGVSRAGISLTIGSRSTATGGQAVFRVGNRGTRRSAIPSDAQIRPRARRTLSQVEEFQRHSRSIRSPLVINVRVRNRLGTAGPRGHHVGDGHLGRMSDGPAGMRGASRASRESDANAPRQDGELLRCRAVRCAKGACQLTALPDWELTSRKIAGRRKGADRRA